jgi:hypothetical protein
MTIDWDAILSKPLADVLGVDAVFVMADGDPPLPIRVLDMTGGAVTGLIGGSLNGRDVAMDTIRPAVDIRAAALTDNGLTAEDLVDAVVTINGQDWIVKSFIPLSNGASQGEYRLVLEEADL